MVVEDDVGMREFLTEVFSGDGYEVTGMGDGESAEVELARLSKEKERADLPVDLVVIDMELPGVNGAELAARLYRKYPALPLLAHTGVGSRENVIAFLRAGACDYVDKPALPADLLARARALIAGKGRTGELQRLQRDMQNELQESKDKIIEYLHGGIKHFFSQPLTVIVGNAAIIRKYAESGKRLDPTLLCEVADEIQSAAQHTARLVNQLAGLENLDNRTPYLGNTEIIKLD